jgi:hypothetical protein
MLTMAGTIGIVGFDFFKNFKVLFDFSNDKLIFSSE